MTNIPQGDKQTAGGFCVTVMPGNHRLQVAAGETILAAGLRHGLGLLYGCRSGFCGTCNAQILQGAVTYPRGRPQALPNLGANACLLCQAVPSSDVQCQVIELIDQYQPQPAQIFTCRVAQYSQLAPDVIRLILDLPTGTRLQFLPGQQVEILLGPGCRPRLAIANAPHEDTHIELHIQHLPGGWINEQILARLSVGQQLSINAPLGSFTLRASDRPLLFVAGGIGFATIKGIIEQALQGDMQRHIYLYWGGRDYQDLYLRTLPEAWSSRYPNLHFIPVLSAPEAAGPGRRGTVQQAVGADHPNIQIFDAYVAGPPVMVEATSAALKIAGLSPAHIFTSSC